MIASDNQKQAAQAMAAAEQAKTAQIEMQLAAVQQQTEAQMELFKKAAIYGGGALAVLMLIRGLTR